MSHALSFQSLPTRFPEQGSGWKKPRAEVWLEEAETGKELLGVLRGRKEGRDRKTHLHGRHTQHDTCPGCAEWLGSLTPTRSGQLCCVVVGTAEGTMGTPPASGVPERSLA